MSFHEQVRQTEATALVEEFGIVAGRLQQFAETLQTTPEQVLAAVDFDPLMDTYGQDWHRPGRPTDPQLRSLAMTSGEFARLSAAIVTDHNTDTNR
jgi:hypothetical protein